MLAALPGGKHHRGVLDRRVPGCLGDQPVFLDQPCSRGQVAGQDVDSGQVAERELEVHERACVPRDLYLAGVKGMPGFEVPQLEGDDAAGSTGGKPELATVFSGAGAQGQEHLKCVGQRRGGRLISLRVSQRDRVEQDIDRAWRLRPGRRGPCRQGRLAHAARPVQITRPQRGPKCFQVCRAGQRGVDGLEAPGRAEQHPRRARAAHLVESDLSAQVLHLRRRERVQRSGLGRDQQAQRRVQRARVPFAPRRRK